MQRNELHPVTGAVHWPPATSSRFILIFRNLADDNIGCQKDFRDRNRVFEAASNNLGRVDDTRLHQIFKLTGGGIETVIRVVFAQDVLDRDRTVDARVERN